MYSGGNSPLFNALVRFTTQALVEVVKVTRFESGPVVDRHDEPPWVTFILSHFVTAGKFYVAFRPLSPPLLLNSS